MVKTRLLVPWITGSTEGTSVRCLLCRLGHITGPSSFRLGAPQRCFCCVPAEFACVSKGWREAPACGAQSCTFQNSSRQNPGKQGGLSCQRDQPVLMLSKDCVCDSLSHRVLHFFSCPFHCKICWLSLAAKKDTFIITVCYFLWMSKSQRDIPPAGQFTSQNVRSRVGQTSTVSAGREVICWELWNIDQSCYP